MATTRIISMYVSHGKTIADCLTDRIDYSKNPDKTQGRRGVPVRQAAVQNPHRQGAAKRRDRLSGAPVL